MTTSADGVTTCDRCGADCGNGGVTEAVVISDLDATDGMVRNLHLCRGTQTVQISETGQREVVEESVGCDVTVLDASTLAHYLSQHAAYERPVRTVIA